MTPEAMQEKLLELAEHQAKCDVERSQMIIAVNELKEDVKATKTLAEDIHIMAINMENMQKTLDNAVKKIDIIERKDYNDYKESKKVIKNNFLSGITGATVSAIIGMVLWVISKMKEGGM